MKFSIDRAAFASELGIALRFAGQKSYVPILSCVLLEIQDGRLKITGSDMDTTVASFCEADITDASGGKLAVPGKLLHDCVSRMTGERLECSSTAALRLAIKGASGKGSIACQDADQFPDLPPVEGEAIELPSVDLSVAIDRALVACDPTSKHDHASRLLLHTVDGVLRVVATDRRRISVCSLSAEGDLRPTVISSRSGTELARLLRSGDKACSLSRNERRLFIQRGNQTAVVAITSTVFPLTYSRYLTQKPNLFQVDAEELSRRVSCVSLAATGPNNEVALSISGETLTISRSSDLGEIEEGMALKSSSCDWSGRFNFNYLLGGISKIDGIADIRHDGGNILSIYPESDNSFVHVVQGLY